MFFFCCIGTLSFSLENKTKQACCICGGGSGGKVVESPSVSPSEEEEGRDCDDYPKGWKDMEGWNCKNYESHENACSKFGDEAGMNGKTANQVRHFVFILLLLLFIIMKVVISSHPIIVVKTYRPKINVFFFFFF